MSGASVVTFLAMERLSPDDSCQNTKFTPLDIFYSPMALSGVILRHLLSLHVTVTTHYSLLFLII